MIADEYLAQLKRDEGLRNMVYDDATGAAIVKGYHVRGTPTIGYGRNLSTHGISTDEADYLMKNDVASCEVQLRNFPWYSNCNEARQYVLIGMAYNLGVLGLMSFHNMLAAIGSCDWERAAEELLSSKAAGELPERYGRYARIMRSGVFP